MTKIEMARYLVDLLAIMSSREQAARPRGTTLGVEYEKVYAEFRATIDKEHENDARKS